MRIVFFGSSDYALPSLEALLERGRPPRLVVTHPDRAEGRGRVLRPAPVAQAAREAGIPCLQPEKVNTPEFLEELAGYEPDLALVISFGRIFSRDLLDLPKGGCFNAHGSLLPKFRGAAPVQRAILAGEERTGVTIIKMNEKMDQGPILLKKEILLGPDEDGASLRRRLAELSASAFLEALEILEKGDPPLEPQDESRATYAPKIKKEESPLDWGLPAREIHRRVLGLQPWPCASSELLGRRLILLGGRPLPLPEGAEGVRPGTILEAGKEGLLVAAGEGAYLVTRLKPGGKREMEAAEFVRGARLPEGAAFSWKGRSGER